MLDQAQTIKDQNPSEQIPSEQIPSEQVQVTMRASNYARRQKARRSRNLALGLMIGALALLFYAVTIVKITKHGYAPNPSFESDVKP